MTPGAPTLSMTTPEGDDMSTIPAAAHGAADIREVEGRLAGTQRSLYADTGASFSVGLAVLAARETLEQLTARADAALLDAKASRLD